MSRNFFSTGFLLKNSFSMNSKFPIMLAGYFIRDHPPPTLEFKSFPLETTKSIIQHLERDYSFVF